LNALDLFYCPYLRILGDTLRFPAISIRVPMRRDNRASTFLFFFSFSASPPRWFFSHLLTQAFLQFKTLRPVHCSSFDFISCFSPAGCPFLVPPADQTSVPSSLGLFPSLRPLPPLVLGLVPKPHPHPPPPRPNDRFFPLLRFVAPPLRLADLGTKREAFPGSCSAGYRRFSSC